MFNSIILTFLLGGTAWSATMDGLNLCIGPYALCSTSYCESIPGNTTHAHCACEGPFEGLNVGNTSCADRSQRLISTFSNREEFTSPIQPPLYSFECQGGNVAPWADCLDAPCSTQAGAIVCTCPVHAASPNFYLGETCPQNATEMKSLCSQLRSTGSTAANMTALQSLLGSFYAKPPSTATCKTAQMAA